MTTERKADDVAGLVERLRHAQNDLSAYSVRAKRGLFKDAASAIESLSARVAELEADARRYQYLRGGKARKPGNATEGLIEVYLWEGRSEGSSIKGDALDNAIDAAIRQRAGRG
jgi:uncharacterized membrane-anchored protein